MSEELKDCPCCEGEAKHVHSAIDSLKRVQCFKCWLITPKYNTSKEAREAWNKRAPVEIDRERLAVLLQDLYWGYYLSLTNKEKAIESLRNAEEIIEMIKNEK